MNRREFLKALGVGAAGAALAGVGGMGEIGKETVILDPHVPLEPFIWTPSSDAHELLSNAHPDFQLVQQPQGKMLMITAPESNVKIGDLLVVTDGGAVETWISGSGDDWIAVALEDARPDGTVAISFNPGNGYV